MSRRPVEMLLKWIKRTSEWGFKGLKTSILYPKMETGNEERFELERFHKDVE